jgi:hypothetical protein
MFDYSDLLLIMVNKDMKYFLLIFEIFVNYEIQSNHSQMLFEVLVIYVFQIQYIVLIFVSKC